MVGEERKSKVKQKQLAIGNTRSPWHRNTQSIPCQRSIVELAAGVVNWGILGAALPPLLLQRQLGCTSVWQEWDCMCRDIAAVPLYCHIYMHMLTPTHLASFYCSIVEFFPQLFQEYSLMTLPR